MSDLITRDRGAEHLGRLELDEGGFVLATFVRANVLAVKASLLRLRGITGVKDHAGQEFKIESQHLFRDHDLMLVRLKLKRLNAIEDSETGRVRRFGLVSAPAVDGAGIVARLNWMEPPRAKQLGCRMAPGGEQGLHITSVSPNSAVSDAKLKVGDVLLEFNRSPASSLDKLRELLKPLQPGDWVSFSVLRGRDSIEGNGQLRHDMSSLLFRAEFLDGRGGALSERRTGFANRQR